jgi:hypothetical protein
MIQPADQFAFADMNGDGITDVVATTGGGIQYMRGRGNGTFEPESQVESFTGTYGIALEDLNADNKVDVVTSTFSSGGTTIMNEKTGFGTPATLPTNYGAVSYHTAIGDFNGDGEPDFILSEAGIFLSVSSYLTPTSLVFPLGTVGTPDPPQTITLTNSGSEAVGITGYTFSGPEPLDFSETNDCEGAIRAHSSCTVTVTYLPIGGSTSTAYLSIEEGSNTAQTVSLTGSASGVAPVVTLSGYQLNWPSVPVGMPGGTAQVKLTNIGNGNLTSLSVAISGTDPSDFAITANTCPPTVRAGAACAVTVQFTPTATGTRSATLTFTDNAYGSPQTVVLEGSGS